MYKWDMCFRPPVNTKNLVYKWGMCFRPPVNTKNMGPVS